MKVVFSDDAWADYLWWQEQPAGVGKVNQLVEDCRRSPVLGTGKPEPLKRELAGYWSRRVTGVHRLVYRVSEKDAAQQLELIACRTHYD